MTHEFKAIVAAYTSSQSQGNKAVLATVVSVDGSSYRGAGVRMLLFENTQIFGAISGGCVEKEVLRESQSVFKTGRAKVMTYDGRFRLGCEGTLYVLLEPFEPEQAALDHWQACFAHREAFRIESKFDRNSETEASMGSTVHFENGTSFSMTETEQLVESSLDSFQEVLPPCFHLIVVGGEHDAIKLSEMGAAMGWEITVICGARSTRLPEEYAETVQVQFIEPEDLVFPHIDVQTAVVLMTHNFAKDLRYLKVFKDSLPLYIGLLGPSKRKEQLLNAFIEYDPEVSLDFMDRVYGPAGLHLAAETPAEIALSILSEILVVQRGTTAIHLQDKKGGIHNRKPQQNQVLK